ncbi:hypothetical protein IFM89_035676 [Coptis chinensis]|uniref:Transmembrane protein n=1 Tax=Coptis chinensis TaxID=261450 RepID=A0A835MGK7_9MAGN|nr:hypothetical protein IFM89_035676 [Coptis chinensis]
MAISSTKSPSPRTKPDSRNTSECARKSFNGNPLTKPSILTNLRSFHSEVLLIVLQICRGGVQVAKKGLRLCEISPSPRKKILGERNEDVSELTEEVFSETQNLSKTRTLESEEVAADYIAPLVSESLKIIAPPSSNEETDVTKPSVSLKPSATPPSHGVPPLDSDPHLPHYEFKAKNVSFTPTPTKPSSSPIPTLAALDSDPHLPPYDPKTNYLSPRPQFLLYKPKPRIQINLEDSFTSESCSDTDNTEETQSSESPKESENASSSEVDQETLVSETEPVNTQVKLISKSKSRSFVRSKIAPFLLVFVIASLFFQVTDTPLHSPSTYEDQSLKFDESARIIEFAKTNFDELASYFNLWSAKTVSYLSTFISVPRVVELDPFNFSNFTFKEEPLVYDEYQFKDFGGMKSEEEDVEIDMELEMDEEYEEMEREVGIEFDMEVEEEYSSIEIEPETLEENEFQDQEFELDSHSNVEPTDVQVTPPSLPLDSPPALTAEPDFLPQVDTLAPIEGSESDVIPQNSELGDFTPTQGLEMNVPLISTNEVEEAFQSPVISTNEVQEAFQSAVMIPENKLTAQNVVGIIVVAVTMVAATAYVYLKQKKATPPRVGDAFQQVLSKKTISRSLSACSEQDQYWSRVQPTETVGDSGPSEVSSSYKRSLGGFGQRGSERVNEVQSQEKRHKRESLASSSEYSGASYGSFTTYEKIQSKHRCGEEEVVTPVRRSSRIRKITSP